jgi:nitroimidazol reductase NimA-like FMN-containing flavoprotein (pyridoxamine 5'-phosphate oxidase superfamily)
MFTNGVGGDSGSELPIDGAGFEILDRGECLRLLGSSDRGRIALNVGALPAILPVQFALDEERVVFCSRIGTDLDRATDRNVVAFQVDGTFLGRDWSVSAVGLAHHLATAAELARAAALPLRRWSAAADADHRFVAVSTERLTGRRALVSYAFGVRPEPTI